MPDSSSKSGSPRQPSSRPLFSGGIGWGSAFRAGMPDSSSKSGSPRQPSSRPPFQEGLAGDPLFELECRIPARKADPQDNLHHGPLLGGIGWGSAFRAGMPDSSSKSGSPRQPSSRPPFRRGPLFPQRLCFGFSAHLVVFFRSAGFACFPRAAPSLVAFRLFGFVVCPHFWWHHCGRQGTGGQSFDPQSVGTQTHLGMCQDCAESWVFCNCCGLNQSSRNRHVTHPFPTHQHVRRWVEP